MIDIHSHVLSGVDDGAVNLEESLEILRAMLADGVEAVVATPHVREDYPTTVDQMRSGLEELRTAAQSSSLPIRILPGGEIAVEALPKLTPADRRAFSLGGSASALLLETPYHGWSSAIEQSIVSILASGLTPVLAHPERNPVVQDQPLILSRLVASGVVVQLTAASLDGRLGRRTATTAHRLLAAELAHVVASDAHSPGVRDTRLSGVAAAVGSETLARWLTHDVPRALIEGATPFPPRPVRAGRRRRLRRRRHS